MGSEVCGGYLTQGSFLAKADRLGNKYWARAEDRWEYISFVISEMEKINPQSILEIGVSNIALNQQSLVLDVSPLRLDNKKNKEWDLNVLPTPFTYKQFDCVVALQVLEHLNDQGAVFKELSRVGKNLIFSFPYKWEKKAGSDGHECIDDSVVLGWAGGRRHDTEFVATDHKRKQRKVYVWRENGHNYRSTSR